MIRRDRTPLARIGAPRTQFRACVLVLWVLLWLPALSLPVEAVARQLPDEDQIRLVALEYLVTTLFPADTAAPAPHCFSLRDEPDFEAPPEGSGRDPGATLLDGIRRFLPDALPVSECPASDPDPDGSAAGGSTVTPVIYSVGALTQAGSVIRAPVSYRVTGLNGGGWACSVGLQSGMWRVIDCLPTWISAPD